MCDELLGCYAALRVHREMQDIPSAGSTDTLLIKRYNSLMGRHCRTLATRRLPRIQFLDEP